MKKRIKLRAMTESEFCRTQECETCPEFLPTLGNQFKTRCMSSIKKMLSGEYAFQQRVFVGYNLYNFEEKTI